MIYEEAVIAMEINAPKEHQKVIANLITGLNTLYKQGQIFLEPYPETMLDEQAQFRMYYCTTTTALKP